MTLLNEMGQVLLRHPWWLLSLLYPLLYIFALNLNEKQKWGSQLHPPIPYLCKTYFFGTLVGIVLSSFLSLYSVHLPFSTMEILLIWFVTIFFSLFGWRLICISYAVALCGLLQWFISLTSYTPPVDWWFTIWWETVRYFSLYDWLWLVALLHLCESFLIRADGKAVKEIVEITNSHQQKINGFQIRQIWPIPLLLPTSVGLFPFTIILSFTDINFSRSMSQQRRMAGSFTFFYAGLLMMMLFLALLFPSLLFAAWLFSWLGHEGIYQWNRYKEQKSTPLFISGESGLQILDVFPHSPAAEMGIKTGDILQRVNSTEVHCIDDITKITQNTAYCKLEILDDKLDHHILHRAIYEKDPHHLGIIGAVRTGEIAAADSKKKENDH